MSNASSSSTLPAQDEQTQNSQVHASASQEPEATIDAVELSGGALQDTFKGPVFSSEAKQVLYNRVAEIVAENPNRSYDDIRGTVNSELNNSSSQLSKSLGGQEGVNKKYAEAWLNIGNRDEDFENGIKQQIGDRSQLEKAWNAPASGVSQGGTSGSQKGEQEVEDDQRQAQKSQDQEHKQSQEENSQKSSLQPGESQDSNEPLTPEMEADRIASDKQDEQEGGVAGQQSLDPMSPSYQQGTGTAYQQAGQTDPTTAQNENEQSNQQTGSINNQQGVDGQNTEPTSQNQNVQSPNDTTGLESNSNNNQLQQTPQTVTDQTPTDNKNDESSNASQSLGSDQIRDQTPEQSQNTDGNQADQSLPKIANPRTLQSAPNQTNQNETGSNALVGAPLGGLNLRNTGGVSNTLSPQASVTDQGFAPTSPLKDRILKPLGKLGDNIKGLGSNLNKAADLGQTISDKGVAGATADLAKKAIGDKIKQTAVQVGARIAVAAAPWLGPAIAVILIIIFIIGFLLAGAASATVAIYCKPESVPLGTRAVMNSVVGSELRDSFEKACGVSNCGGSTGILASTININLDGIPGLAAPRTCPEINAFTRMISISEGGDGPHPYVTDKNLKIYYYRFPNKPFRPGGGHPNVCEPISWRPGLCSTAAGRYQFLTTTWEENARKAGVNVNDFSPANQDKAVMALLDTLKVTDALCNGSGSDLSKLDTAMRRASGTWTSLKGGAEENSKTSQLVGGYLKLLEQERGLKTANLEVENLTNFKDGMYLKFKSGFFGGQKISVANADQLNLDDEKTPWKVITEGFNTLSPRFLPLFAKINVNAQSADNQTNPTGEETDNQDQNLENCVTGDAEVPNDFGAPCTEGGGKCITPDEAKLYTLTVVSCFYRTDGSYHGAVDYQLRKNGSFAVPIPSIVSGVVETVDTNPTGYGINVSIKAKEGLYYNFAHMSKRYVNPGDKISVGQIIGIQGQTGHAEGPHVHFNTSATTYHVKGGPGQTPQASFALEANKQFGMTVIPKSPCNGG